MVVYHVTFLTCIMSRCCVHSVTFIWRLHSPNPLPVFQWWYFNHPCIFVTHLTQLILSLLHTLTHTHTLSQTHSLSHTHTHSLTNTLTHTHTHSVSHTLTLTHTHTHSTHTVTLTHTHTHTLSLTKHTHSHTHTHSPTHSSLSLTLTSGFDNFYDFYTSEAFAIMTMLITHTQ